MSKSLIILALIIHGYILSQSNYKTQLDSAEFYCYKNPDKARFFLKKIPKPLDKSIPGNLAKYYQLTALINHIKYESSQEYYNYFIALKYAREEENYDIAAMVCIELYYNIYRDSYDSRTANKYLISAKKYYTLSNNKVGLIDVSQLSAYEKYVNKDYINCRKIILAKLNNYKNYDNKNPKVFLLGLVMLTASELQLRKYHDAYKHYAKLKSLKHSPHVESTIFNAYIMGIESHLAEVYLQENKLDSTIFYLKKLESKKNGQYMFFFTKKRYYTVQAEYCRKVGKFRESKTYLDSLSILQNEQIKRNLQGSYIVQEAMLEYNHELAAKSRKNTIYILLLCMITAGLTSSFFYYHFSRKKKIYKQKDFFSDNKHTIQLALKINEMESYIKNLKIDVRKISKESDKEKQDQAIQELYRKLHTDSSRIFNQTEYLTLINEIKSDFATKLTDAFPTLDNQDIIICHYVYSGLLNKEIATYLNQTIRSVEGKRYRISKKIGLTDKGIKLADFLQQFFESDTNKNGNA